MKKTAVIIPTLNEEENIEKIINDIQGEKLVSHIIVVDDSSKDDTTLKVKNLMNEYSNVFLIQRKDGRNFGKSYKDGFKKAMELGADILIQMDADGSHDPVYIKDMINAIDTYDFVIGSRYMKGGGIEKWSKPRKLLSKGANLYAKLLLRIPHRDVTSGFNVWRKEVIESIDFSQLSNKGYVFQVWLKWNAHNKKFKGVEVPIIFTERKLGVSKLNYKMIFESLYEIFKLAIKQQ